MAADIVSVRDLEKTFRPKWWRRSGSVQALRGVTLSVPEGTIFGLLGPNGSGKSTLVKLLLGIYRPTGGTALLLGGAPRRAVARRGVGFQPEDARIPDYHTARSFLHYCGALSGMRRGELAMRIDTLLEEVGIGKWRDVPVRQFSKGMRQRLTLAQAILHRPRVLFLDEPTDGLDPLGRVEIRDLLLDLKREGATIFVNSHILSEVEAVCDRVMILDKGKVAATGTIAELTLHSREYEILLDRWDPAWGEALSGLTESCEMLAPAGLVVKVSSEEALDRVVDFFRERNARVRGLSRRHATLEQVFLSVIGRRPGAL